MPQPISPMLIEGIALALRVFMAEVRAIRLDKDRLLRDVIARVDGERLAKAYDYLKSLTYERGKS